MAEKEVLVVFGKRRRPVSIAGDQDSSKEYESLLSASKEVFKDILDSSEGSSSSNQLDGPRASYYFQVESKKWGHLIDLEGIRDGDVIHMFKEEEVSTNRKFQYKKQLAAVSVIRLHLSILGTFYVFVICY